MRKWITPVIKVPQAGTHTGVFETAFAKDTPSKTYAKF